MNVEIYNSESFKAVADSIREKVGTENKLSFPNGFLKNIEKCDDSLAKRFTLESYSSEKVTKIPKYAFYKGNIKSIDCPNVTEIGDYSFSDAEFLTNINFPNTEKIGQRAFYNIPLTELVFPKVKEIGDLAFYGHGDITRVVLGNVEKIGS